MLTAYYITHMQNASYNVAALTAVFLRLSDIDFFKKIF